MLLAALRPLSVTVLLIGMIAGVVDDLRLPRAHIRTAVQQKLSTGDINVAASAMYSSSSPKAVSACWRRTT
jgi:hypothetical protein